MNWWYQSAVLIRTTMARSFPLVHGSGAKAHVALDVSLTDTSEDDEEDGGAGRGGLAEAVDRANSGAVGDTDGDGGGHARSAEDNEVAATVGNGVGRSVQDASPGSSTVDPLARAWSAVDLISPGHHSTGEMDTSLRSSGELEMNLARMESEAGHTQRASHVEGSGSVSSGGSGGSSAGDGGGEQPQTPAGGLTDTAERGRSRTERHDFVPHMLRNSIRYIPITIRWQAL